MSTRVVPLPGALDLERTTAALGMKAVRGAVAAGATAWWSSRTPEGPVSVQITSGPGRVAVRAWGRGADWALDRATDLIGADDRPENFEPGPGLVGRLHAANPGLRLGRTNRVFEALLPAILGQKVTSREAKRSGARLVASLGEPSPGPSPVRLPPAPARVAELGYEDLHPFGIERKRAVVIIEAARRVARLEEILDMERDAAYARLTAIRGIGRWTAAHVMGIAWGDRDAVPVGDFHLPNTVSYALAAEPRADDDRMLELLEPYRGHRRRVVMLLQGCRDQGSEVRPASRDSVDRADLTSDGPGRHVTVVRSSG